jgi:hypothetical protein
MCSSVGYGDVAKCPQGIRTEPRAITMFRGTEALCVPVEEAIKLDWKGGRLSIQQILRKRKVACSPNFDAVMGWKLPCMFACLVVVFFSQKLKTKLRDLSPQANYTELPPLGGELSANFCGYKSSRGFRNGSPQTYSRVPRPEPLLFLPSSSSVVLTSLSGPRSRPTT